MTPRTAAVETQACPKFLRGTRRGAGSHREMAEFEMQVRRTGRQFERGRIAGQGFGAALLLSEQASQRLVIFRVGWTKLYRFPQFLLGPLVVARVGE